MVTRLGLYGGPRGRYGSFAGKTEQEGGAGLNWLAYFMRRRRG